MLLRVSLVAIGLFAGQSLLVAAAAASRPRANIYATIVAVSLVTAPIVFLSADRIAGVVTGDGRIFLVLIHLALGGFLFHFMTLPDRSVTLRVLVELLLAPDRTLSVEALTRRYSVEAMITSRLEQMEQGRFLSISDDGGLRLERRGVWFGRFVAGGRRLFRLSSAN